MRTRGVLLVEDQAMDIFARRFLKRRGFKPNEIRSLGFPGGAQSGEQWVRTKYPDELRALSGVANTFLVVATDADTHTTARHRSTLDEECRRRGLDARTRNERVIVIVPRRNIQTWFEYLDGRDVDETTAYPKGHKTKDVRRLADELYRMCHEQQRLDDRAPESLSQSCAEYAKLRR